MRTIIVAIVCLFIGIGAGLAVPKLIESRYPSTNTAMQQKAVDTEESDTTKALVDLRSKKGSDFDKEYLSLLIANSQYSIDIANLAEGRTEREEIKKWSKFLIDTEPNSINALKTLYGQWGYRTEDINNNPDKH